MTISKEKKAAYDRQYREKNKEKSVAREKEYYKTNKQKIATKNKNYYAKNKEKLLAYNRNYYVDNKDFLIQKTSEHRENKRKLVNEVKYLNGCCICGEDHPATLDFHHRNPEEKLFSIADGVGHSVPKLLEEINKCDVICSNCHRKMHWRQQ